jgi:hypothetical protein
MENVFSVPWEGELVLKFVDVVQVFFFFSSRKAKRERRSERAAPFSFSSTHVNGNYEPHNASHPSLNAL